MKDSNCMYCVPNENLDKLMMPVCELETTTLYLFRDQTYLGRCAIALNDHISNFCELDDHTAEAFARDMKRTVSALSRIFSPDKINMGFYSDKLPHLHCHFAPKYKDGPDFGSTFTLKVLPPHIMPDEWYDEIKEKLRKELAKYNERS